MNSIKDWIVAPCIIILLIAIAIFGAISTGGLDDTHD